MPPSFTLGAWIGFQRVSNCSYLFWVMFQNLPVSAPQPYMGCEAAVDDKRT